METIQLQINEELKNSKLGKPLFLFESVSSTNAVLKAKAEAGAPEGCTVVANSQTQGRGRQGKRWLSLPGKGLYMSVLLRPNWRVSELGFISLLSALAVASALEQLGIERVQLKWPNDVFSDGRKIAGILVESQTDADAIKYSIIGIGINILHDVQDLSAVGKDAATSCRMEGIVVSRNQVLIRVLKELNARYSVLTYGTKKQILTAWAKHKVPLKEVKHIIITDTTHNRNIGGSQLHY